jgi:phosphoglycolate phosphatase-like HAD superfamily hydrolase
LIFDVDGVLIDSSASYQTAIRCVVESEWLSSGLEADAPGYSEELNAAFKAQGAFNDDYDIAWALLNIAAASGRAKLSEAMPALGALGAMIADCGRCEDWLPKKFVIRHPRDRIRRLCGEAYAGSGGLWRMDRPSVGRRWSEFPLPVYVYTGRDLAEWRLGTITLGWEDMPLERVVHLDSGVKKPSAEGISRICGGFGHSRPIYFGDTESDRMSFEAFAKTGKPGWFAGIGEMLKGEPVWFPDLRSAMRELFDF